MSRTGLRIGRHVEGGKNLLQGLSDSLDAPATALQMFCGNPNRNWASHTADEDREKFLSASEGLYKVVHAPYVTNIGAPFEERGNVMTRHGLVNNLKWCAAHGFDALVFHPGSAKDGPKTDALESAEAALRDVLIRYDEEAASEGLPNTVKLVLENSAGDRGFKLGDQNSPGRKLGSDIDELVKLVRKIGDPRLKIAVDTTHAWAAGYTVDHMIRKILHVKDLIELIHFNTPDPEVERGSYRDRHSHTLDEGRFSLHEVQLLFLALREFPLILEGTPGTDGLRSDLSWLLSWELELKKNGVVQPPKVLKSAHEDDIFSLGDES